MPHYGEITDSELVSLLNKKDHAAFTEIYDRYWRAQFIHAYKILNDEADAADVLQDVFTALWCRTDEWQLESSLAAYLYTAVRNRCLKLIAKGGRREAFANELALAFNEGINAIDESVDLKELLRCLEVEVMALPPKMQQVYIKSREEGLTHKQIAEEMGIAENSVKTTMHRTLNSLRAKLSPLLSLLIFLIK
ncbi:RNA polymerase sigma-70 factor [Mucilaginibacter sp. JRF]|uniref:RNA polymerase sigma factor n=1 Tax=Mucilaginibacter sp. JRF TaxID=2780088 RepID=UPI00187EF192|nr:RNA polymerase sigma-70 factor [Mucilaginibacter sp. JRF]MBE9583164.1 RNA polymerase sigma-70 factor [Mucilaginibacter sp. JRF]